MKQNLPRISIVIPSFNQGEFIAETLSSLVNQEYPNLEIIVIDGGSTDNTIDVIKSFEKSISYWESEKDKGQTHAINKGLKHVTGDLFNWLNSDDVMEKGAMFHLAELYNKHPEKNLFLGKTKIFKKNSTDLYSGKILFEKPEITLGYGQLNQPGMFYKTEVIKKIQPLDEILNMCMDLDLWIKYLIHYGQEKVLETSFCLAGFRLHEKSKTISIGHEFRKERDALYNKLYQDKNPKLSEHQKKTIALSENYFHLWRADEMMLNQDFESSQISLNKVNFKTLTLKEKRRYVGVSRRILKHSFLKKIKFKK